VGAVSVKSPGSLPASAHASSSDVAPPRGSSLGGGGVGGLQADHAGNVAAGDGLNASEDLTLHVAHGFNGAGLGAMVMAPAIRAPAAAISSRAMVRIVSVSSGVMG
jgi:hypothetical protein